MVALKATIRPPLTPVGRIAKAQLALAFHVYGLAVDSHKSSSSITSERSCIPGREIEQLS